MTCLTVMQLPESSTITHPISASDSRSSNVDLITHAPTSTTIVNNITASTEQDKMSSLDRAILLQKSEKPSDFTAFVNLLPSLFETGLPELLSAAKQFNPNAIGAFIRELYKRKIFDFDLFSHYWNNYTTELPYAGLLRRWTFSHAIFPASIVKHLETFDKKDKKFKSLCDAIWLQRNLFPLEEKRSFCHYYLNYLIESKRFFDAEWALIEGKACLTTDEFTDYFKYLDEKEPIEKDSDWVVPFKQRFHEALDAKQYEEAVYALMQIRRFLRVEDGDLYLPALALTFLKVLWQEKDKVLRADALLQFDRLFTSEEEMSHWVVLPHLFTEGVILYLQMTSAPIETCIIKEICRLQSDLRHPNRNKWTLLLFKYLSSQSHWPQASLPYVNECFVKNPNFLDRYFSQNQDPEFLLNLSVLCLQNKIDDNFLEKCFEGSFKSVLIKNFPEKTSAFIELYTKKNLQASSKVELALKIIVLLGMSKERFPLIKAVLDILLTVEKNVLQTNFSMAKGYVDLFDILLENDSCMCMKLLDKLYKIEIDDHKKCYKKYLEKLLNAGKLEDAFDFCNTFAQNVSEQEIIPYLQKEQLSAPSPTLEEFILKYMTSFPPEFWIRFSLHLHKTNQSDLVIDYFQYTLNCLKKIKANISKELNGEELSAVFVLLKFCADKICKQKNTDKIQQELCLFIPEFIVQCPLSDKSDQIALLSQFQDYALNHSEKRFLEAFRRQAKQLLGYNALHTSAKTGETLFPEYNDLQEIKKMGSLPFPKELQPLFARVYYYLDRIEKLKGEAGLQAAEGLSAVICQLLTKDLDKRNIELQSILAGLLSKDVKLLGKINHYQWLDTLLRSPYKNSSHFFQRILTLTLKCISEEDVYLFLSARLLEYMESENVILNDNIRELLKASSLSIKNRAEFLHQILSFGCSHILRLEIKHHEDSLFLGIEDSNDYLASSLSAITEYLHLMEKPESFLPLLKQLYEGVAFILSREANKSRPRIELERAAKYRLMMNFLKKLLDIDLNASVKASIVKNFLYAFAHQEDIAHRVIPEENRKLLIEVVRCLGLNSLEPDLKDELMSFFIQLEYRGLLLTNLVYENERKPIWKKKAMEAVIADAKYYSKIILEKIDANSFDNLSLYIDCLKLGIFKELMHLDKENRKTYIGIFKEFLKHMRMKSYEFPRLELEFLEVYRKLDYPIEDELVSSANEWETVDKEAFFAFLFELTRVMQLVARNTLTGTFHISCKRSVGYIIEIKGNLQKLVDNDLKKNIEEASVLTEYLTFCHDMLKRSLKKKQHVIFELYIKILENLFEKIKNSNSYKNVFEQEKDAIFKALDPFLKADFGIHESRLAEIKRSYKQIIDEKTSPAMDDKALPICKDLADDLNTLLNSDSPLSEENVKQFENVLEGNQTDLIERILWDKLVVKLFDVPTKEKTNLLLRVFDFFAQDRITNSTFIKSILNELLALPVLNEQVFDTLIEISFKLQLSKKEISEIFQPVFKEYLRRTTVENDVPFEVIFRKGIHVGYDPDYILRTPIFFAKNIGLLSVMQEGLLLIPHIIYMQSELISRYPFEKFEEVHISMEKDFESSNVLIEETPIIVFYWKNTLETLHAAWKEGSWDQNYEKVLLKVHKKLLELIKEKNLDRDFFGVMNIAMSFVLTPLKTGLNLNKKLMQQFETVFSDNENYKKWITFKKGSIPEQGYYRFNDEFENKCVKLAKQIATTQSLEQANAVIVPLKMINDELMVCKPLEMPHKVLNAFRLIKEIINIKDETLKELLFFSEESLGLAGIILDHLEMHPANLSRKTLGDSYPYFLNEVVKITYEYSTYCLSFKLEKWIAHDKVQGHLHHMTTLFNLKRLLRDQIEELHDQAIRNEIQRENIYLEYINFLNNMFMFHQNNETYQEIINRLENVFLHISDSYQNPKEKNWVSSQIVVFKLIIQHWVQELANREMPKALKGNFGLTLLQLMF